MRLRSLFRVLAVVGGAAFSGCSCSHSSAEPGKDPAFHPTSPDGLAAAPLTPAQQASMTEKEFHDWHVRLQQELCNIAGKKWNQLNGKPDFDKDAMHYVMRCNAYGNEAWYKCIVGADTADAFRTCSTRFLGAPTN